MMSVLSLPFRAVLDFALPPRCAGCGVIVDGTGKLCTDCWGSLRFLPRAGCPSCGVPMPLPGLICAPCLAHPPSHDGVRAAVAYGGIASDVAIRLKHGRRIGLAGTMAKAMARHGEEAEGLIVPVPLHRWRLWRRGFNQSALLARKIGSMTGGTLRLDLLERVKSTPSLGGLGSADRKKALRGAIRVPKGKWPDVRGQKITLIDDVYTSGATANACAAALKRAGAARVTVLCWARVLRDD